jgi:hypothetical protein
MERAVLQALAAFRWVAWAWMAVVLLLSRDDLDHPVVAVVLVAAALALTAGWASAWRWRPSFLCTPTAVVAELGLGAALLVFDGWVFGRGHAFSTSQSLASTPWWPGPSGSPPSPPAGGDAWPGRSSPELPFWWP